MSKVYVVEIDRYYHDGIETTWAGIDKDDAFAAAQVEIEEDWESVCIDEFADGKKTRTWYYGGSSSSRPGKKHGWIETALEPNGDAE